MKQTCLALALALTSAFAAACSGGSSSSGAGSAEAYALSDGTYDFVVDDEVADSCWAPPKTFPELPLTVTGEFTVDGNAVTITINDPNAGTQVLDIVKDGNALTGGGSGDADTGLGDCILAITGDFDGTMTADDEFRRMFMEEAKLAARLVHPNVVPVFDFGEVGPDWFIAMDYQDGSDLAALKKRMDERGAKLPAEIGVYVVSEVAKALAYAHSGDVTAGKSVAIIHRDVSPQNVLLSYRGDVKVTDFGIAKAVDGSGSTRIGFFKGKVGYLSPEQARYEPIDTRSDLFSLGTLLFETLTGKRLFTGTSADEIFERLRTFEHLDLTSLGRIPAHLREIVDKALRGSPDDRYQEAWEMERDLVSALGENATVARNALASLMKMLFADEIARETEDAETEGTGEYVIEETDDTTGEAILAGQAVPGMAPRSKDPTHELTLAGGENANRRRSSRVKLRVWAQNDGLEEFSLWLRPEDIRRDFRFCYRTVDVSSEGVFLETTTPLDVGTEMDLAFRLPGSTRSIKAFGEVVRIVRKGTRATPGMAVLFKTIDPASKASLDAFLIAQG